MTEQLDADTISSDSTLWLYNERHQLRIVGTGQGGFNYDRAFRIQLIGPDGMVLDTVLTKASFTDGLDPEFLDQAGLYALDFDFVRSSSLYLKAFIGVEGTDQVQPIGLLIPYSGPQRGRMLHWLLPEDPVTTE